jgi:hypothetical protein
MGATLPISAPRVAQKIKRQHHRIDERLQRPGCAVVVVRCHDDPLLRRFRSQEEERQAQSMRAYEASIGRWEFHQARTILLLAPPAIC